MIKHILSGLGVVSAITTISVLSYGVSDEWFTTFLDHDDRVKNSKKIIWNFNGRAASVQSYIITVTAKSKKDASLNWECLIMWYYPTIDFSFVNLSVEEDYVKTFPNNLEKAVKNNSNEAREIFVENCLGNRMGVEEQKKLKSEIILEVEKDGNKYKPKDFEKIYKEKNYKGLLRLTEENSALFNNDFNDGWAVEIEGESNKKFKLTNTKQGSFQCIIEVPTDFLETETAKTKLKTTLEAGNLEIGKNDKNYLIRNCLVNKTTEENKYEIKGLTQTTWTELEKVLYGTIHRSTVVEK